MDLFDMPATLEISEAYLEKINRGDEPVAELVTFLQDHVSVNLLDYGAILGFQGYEDSDDPRVIVVESREEKDFIIVKVNLEYSLIEQQNSCADSLARIKHSARLIYTYKFWETYLEFEVDSEYLAPDCFPADYGY